MSIYDKPDTLAKLLASNETYYSNMHANMRFMDKLYNRQFESIIDLPGGIPIHRSSTPTLMVDELRDQIRVDEPVVVARAFGASSAAETTRDMQQTWGTGVLSQAREGGLVDPFAQARHDLLLRGAGCIKWAVQHEALMDVPEDMSEDDKEDWERERMNRSPFFIKAVDPLLLYPSPGAGALRYMLEVHERRAMDMWEEYPGWSDPKTRLVRMSQKEKDNPLRTVKWVEYWSWVLNPKTKTYGGWYIVEVDGERIIDSPNVYGHVPYAYRYSGLGRVDAGADPIRLAVGVLDQNSGEIEAEVRIKTAMDAQWQYHVFPVLVVEGMTAEEARTRLAVGPGAIVDVPPGSVWNYLQRDPPSQQMMNFLDQIRLNIDKKVSPALSGQRTADFGIHQALQIGQAIKIISPIKASLNNLASQTLDSLATLMSRFNLSMNVFGTGGKAGKTRSVDGSDFERHNFEVTYEAIDPAENDRRMLAALSVKNSGGIISRKTYREHWLKGVVESNEDEEDRVLEEMLIDQAVASGALLPFIVQEMKAQGDMEAEKGMAGQARQALGETLRGSSARTQAAESLAGTGLLAETAETAQAGQIQGGV